MQWACYKKASAYGSRVGWTPARRNNNSLHTELILSVPEVLCWWLKGKKIVYIRLSVQQQTLKDVIHNVTTTQMASVL